MNPPALVILAAGVGSRYGGPKQLEPVGPGGATLMDYSIYDARRAAFRNVVFVVRPDLETPFRELVGERYGARIEATIALQRLEEVPAGVTVPAARAKPWGTGHAVLAAESEVHGPFAVVNADDFYGRGAFETAAEFLRSSPSPSLVLTPCPPLHNVERGDGTSSPSPEGRGGQGVRTPVFANVAYPLSETVSAAGGVNRAVCRVTPDGWLEAVEEVTDIRRSGDGRYVGADPRGRPVEVPGDALVSMNMWAFTPAVFDILRRGFAEFVRRPDADRSEFLIPHAIRDAVLRGEARVRLLRANSRWLGMTYPADRPLVEGALRDLVAAGEYPERLWE